MSAMVIWWYIMTCMASTVKWHATIVALQATVVLRYTYARLALITLTGVDIPHSCLCVINYQSTESSIVYSCTCRDVHAYVQLWWRQARTCTTHCKIANLRIRSCLNMLYKARSRLQSSNCSPGTWIGSGTERTYVYVGWASTEASIMKPSMQRSGGDGAITESFANVQQLQCVEIWVRECHSAAPLGRPAMAFTFHGHLRG